MSAEDIIKTNGTLKNFKDDSGGATLIDHPVLGIVKNNIDPTHNGRIQVYIAKYCGPDPNNASNWITVNYLSPYYGIASPKGDPTAGPETGFGTYPGTPNSYGFWATAPDIGTTVVCVFINGHQDKGYYIGCVPQIGLTHMVPAIGASSSIVPNEGESTKYGGGDRLPVAEVNYSNSAIRQNQKIYNASKPIHSYQAYVLAQQGLIRDNIRGVISSSSVRETPSRVYGISTPGSPIYEGGYTNQTIKQAVNTADSSKLQMIGRTGGHTFVMDDGTIDGNDQLVRIRTSAGHMIMLNDSNQVITIMHSNGQTYIEMGKEGTIDLYSTNSVNIRTEGDLNLHADRDINLNAKRNINAFGNSVNLESTQNTSLRAGGSFKAQAIANYTVLVNGEMSFASSGNSSFLSSATTYINGSKINLNTGASATVPAAVPEIPKIQHINSVYSVEKGWINPSPYPIVSITTRAPTHMPWVAANQGVLL